MTQSLFFGGSLNFSVLGLTSTTHKEGKYVDILLQSDNSSWLTTF